MKFLVDLTVLNHINLSYLNWTSQQISCCPLFFTENHIFRQAVRNGVNLEKART